MERIKLSQIRKAQLFERQEGDNNPSAVKGSNHGDTAIIFGYTKGDVLIDKNGIEYPVCKPSTFVERKRTFEFVGDKTPKYGEVFADLDSVSFLDYLICDSNTIFDDIVDPLRSVSVNKIGAFLDYIEEEYNKRDSIMLPKKTVLAKLRTLRRVK